MTRTISMATMNAGRVRTGFLVGILALAMTSAAHAGPTTTTAPTPYTVTCETSFVVASLSAECSDLLIPVGKKFVIQQILFSAWLPTGQSLLPGINYGVNSVSSGQTFFQIPTQKQIWNTADLHSASLPVTIYTDVNPGLTLFLTRNNSTGTGWARVILIGQLVAP
jgi:hypothetical protein